MKIIVLSCDKNQDLWAPFHHCMEKYWFGHPEIIYFTESMQNPYYKTISVPHDLQTWTTGVRTFLRQIEDDAVLLMIDDIFIRKQVDTLGVSFAEVILFWETNTALLNFEESFDPHDIPTEYEDWKVREHGSAYEVSLMCGLWNTNKLLTVLDRDCSPWDIELHQDNKGFDYFIHCGKPIIDWGYTAFQPCGVVKGKWAREVVSFFESEGISIDYSIRGFHN